MKLYITPVKFCSHVKGKKPSQITPNMLRKVQGGGLLEKCAANAWEAMVAAAKADGIKLAPTSSADCFRSIETQTKGFLIRYSKTPLEGASTRTWNGVKWYLKKGNAPLAAPNDDAKTCSRHMLGIAVDVASANGDRLKWMHENLKKFGFSWEVVPEEPWHIRMVCGDNVPPAVQAWVDANGSAAPVVSEPVVAPQKAVKPATPAGKGMHWKWNGAEWVAVRNLLLRKKGGA